jgi:hypothetical protein
VTFDVSSQRGSIIDVTCHVIAQLERDIDPSGNLETSSEGPTHDNEPSRIQSVDRSLTLHIVRLSSVAALSRKVGAAFERGFCVMQVY